MAFVWIEKRSKRKPERSETAITSTAAAPLEMINCERVANRHIPGAHSPTHGAPEHTTTRIVNVKAAVCIVCGFHEEAEDGFVHFHCGMFD